MFHFWQIEDFHFKCHCVQTFFRSYCRGGARRKKFSLSYHAHNAPLHGINCSLRLYIRFDTLRPFLYMSVTNTLFFDVQEISYFCLFDLSLRHLLDCVWTDTNGKLPLKNIRISDNFWPGLLGIFWMSLRQPCVWWVTLV